MQDAQSNLTVRVHERHACELPASIRAQEADREQLRLTGSASRAAGVTPVTMIDCSSGGIGLDTTVFLPKFARLELVVEADAETGRPEFRASVRVRRVVMLDHTPRYFVGTSFEDPAIATSPEFAALVGHIQSLNERANDAHRGERRA